MKAKRKEAQRRSAVAVAAPPAAKGLKLWHYCVALAAAIIAAFEVYGPALHGPFVFDDMNLPFARPEAGGMGWAYWIGGVRPLLMASYWFNFADSGTDPFSYHIFNVLFHVVDTVLLFFIIRKVLALASVARNYIDLFAGFAAGLFLLHPLQTESVAYIAGRSETVSVMFLFAAFCLFLYRRSRDISVLAAVGILALFACALASKEHTVVLPAVLLLTDYFWNPGFSFDGIRRNWRLYVPMVLAGAAGAAYVLLRVLQSSSAGFKNKDFTWYQYFFTQCRAIFVYFRLFLFPAGQSIDHQFAPSRNLFDHGALIGLVALAAMVAAAVYFRRRYKLAAYGLFLFLILIAPTSSFIPIADPIAERRLYMPMMGLLLVVLEFVRRINIERRALAAVLAGVCVIAGICTYRRSAIWSDGVSLWRDAVAHAPGRARDHFALGNAYFRERDCGRALTEYAQAAKLGQPPSYGMYWNWAQAYSCVNQPEQALSMYRKAAASQATAPVYSSIGMLEANLNRPADAIASLEHAVQLDPSYAPAYVFLGGVYLALAKLPEAGQYFSRALALDPGNQTARNGMAAVQAGLQKQK